MGIVSYAQNFEDVMLWRALGHIEKGTYIDVGAQDPIVDSVSKAFYEHGWRGIHVEPTFEFANRLREDRPDEIVVQALVAERPGVLDFYEIPGGGLSTACRDIAEDHRNKIGCQVVQTLVTSVTLDELFALVPGDEIHWLKIDVEGFEKDVLAGWKLSLRHPWVIVVEATYPNTTVETFEQWESLVLKHAYKLVYCDGLNRYYLSEKHLELSPHFDLPPNVFDGFQLSGTATSITSQIVTAGKKELAEITQQKLEAERQLVMALALHKANEAEAERRERSLSTLATQTLEIARSGAQVQLTELVQRERAFAEELSGVRKEARQALEVQGKQQLEREQLLQAELMAVRRVKDKVEADLLSRERAFAEELSGIRKEARQALVVQGKQQLEREQQLQAELMAVRGAKDKVEADLLGRERTFAEQFSRVQSDAHLAFETISRLKIELIFACSTIAEMRKSRWWRFTHPLSNWGGLYEKYSADSAVALERHLNNLSKAPNPLVNHDLKFAAEEAAIKSDCRVGNTLNKYLEGQSMTISELLSKPKEIFIRLAYREILGRDIDAAEFEYYSSMLMLGKSRTSILFSLCHSKEAKTALGPYRDLVTLDDAAFIDAIYQRLLGRSPDPEGRCYYLAKLQLPNGRGCVIRDIELSGEAFKFNPGRAAFRRDLEGVLRKEEENRGWRRLFMPNKRIEARLNQTLEMVVSLSAQLTSLQSSLNVGFSMMASAQLSEVSEGQSGESMGEKLKERGPILDLEVQEALERPSAFQLVATINADSPEAFFSELASVLAISREAI